MGNTEIENIMEEYGIRPTANRILVVKELIKASHPISLADLELALDPMDKSSIFRVIDLLAKKDLIHVIEDGSRSLKYEMCTGHGHHDVSDQHAHFFCEKCGSVFCLDDIPLPPIELPSSYKLNSVNFMLKGICPNCNK